MGLILILAGAAGAAMELPAFLTGCWEQVDGDRWTQECWMEPRGGIMLGASREGRGDTLGSFEWARIVRGTDGKLQFHPAPGGKPAAPFITESASATEVRFVNPAHDYPQRVRYWREGDLLKAEISKTDGSQKIAWTYRREGADR